MAMTQDTQARWRPDPPDYKDGTAPVIVVGLDDSSSSWDAFGWAAGEAVRIHGTVVAVNVAPFIEAAGGFGVLYDWAGAVRARREFVDELKTEAARRGNELGVAVSFVTEYGDPAHALTDVARGLHASLIVVGRSAKTFHHLAGSLSHRLTSRNDAPVVVVVP
jgi:nucleotide-binding universal stress UspA family protein